MTNTLRSVVVAVLTGLALMAAGILIAVHCHDDLLEAGCPGNLPINVGLFGMVVCVVSLFRVMVRDFSD